ncbi:hypothetical protein HMPREF9413_2190 [Paenibacillus sp. HGF7]|nr:hypothetical protein HMPREF9413_2190 [Paenibacillus sp. HGF7]
MRIVDSEIKILSKSFSMIKQITGDQFALDHPTFLTFIQFTLLFCHSDF